MIDIVAAVCTRETLHSRAAEGMDVNLINSGLRWDRVWEHDKPIPDAQNSVIERALALSPEWVWMVEEDVEAPPDALAKMLAVEHPVVTAKYRLRGGQWCHIVNNQNRLIFAGTGCLLIHAVVLRMMERPWFRSDLLYAVDPLSGNWSDPVTTEREQYGKHDVHFFASLAKQGIYGALSDVTCKHWHVKTPGKANSNNGCHLIEEVA